jgi:hypothetical protein
VNSITAEKVGLSKRWPYHKSVHDAKFHAPLLPSGNGVTSHIQMYLKKYKKEDLLITGFSRLAI